jgi:predicted PurR-regulated permease PerM
VSEQQPPGRLDRWRRRLPDWRRVAGRPAAQPAARPRRPRRADTGVPTLDDLLNPRAEVAEPAPAPQSQTETETPGETETPAPAPVATSSPEDEASQFGAPGRPINRGHPFYVGFVGALGVFIAWGLVGLLGRLSGVITLLVVSLFLALGLEPVVGWLQRRGAPRPAAILAVFLGVVAVFAAFISSVIPPVVSQASELVSNMPQYIESAQVAIERSGTLRRIDAEYQVTQRISDQLQQRLASGETVTALFGGIFGAGKAVVSGIFSALTVLVLTLYFLASLPHLKRAGYRLVPATRRQRVALLGDEVSRRIGGYVIGQLALASINGACSYVVLTIVGIPYAAVLAFTVGLLGIIPLVGATLGAVIVVVVALFSSVSDAVILGIYYLAYQQFENYVLAPRIMARTVSVPGAVALVAALAGASVFGILGALIAIPLAAGVLLIVEEVVMPQQDRA